MTFKRLSFLLSFLLAANIQLLAGGLTGAKYAGEFLGLGAGGRSLGMGSAYVAVARDVSSGYWNPAGLAHIQYPQFMLMHSSQFSGEVNYDFGSFGMPVGRQGSLGFSIIRVGVDDIIRTKLLNPNLKIGEVDPDTGVRNVPVADGTFTAADYALFLTYSKLVSGTFSYGANVKLLHRGLGDNSAWGIGFDLGFMMNPMSNLMLGVNIQDITTTLLAWDTGRRELIRPTIRAGLSYPLRLDMRGGVLQPALDFVFRFENRDDAALGSLGNVSVDVNVGWEYLYRGSFAVRLGFADLGQGESSQVSLGQLSAGVGLRFAKLSIDYAYLGHEDLGNTHRISASLSLQEPKFKRK